MRDLDFVDVATSVLKRVPNAVVLAVGVRPDERWEAAAAKVGNRLRAVGIRDDVERFHEIADLYVEGFPLGSTTALLEAGLAGIPLVFRLPRTARHRSVPTGWRSTTYWNGRQAHTRKGLSSWPRTSKAAARSAIPSADPSASTTRVGGGSAT